MKSRTYCAFFGCMNSKITRPEITFFRLPANSGRRMQWLQLIHREDLENKHKFTSYRVCEEHFHLEDILQSPNRKLLKKNALPKGATRKEDKQTQTVPLLVVNDGGNSSTKKAYDNAGASNTSDVQYQTSRYSMIEGNVGAEDAAVEEIIIKEEITEEEKTQCRLCLSVGRRMQELGEHAALYRKLLFENHYKNTTIPSFMFDMLACWECHAELRRVRRFQEKVRRANAAFETGQNQNCGDLSNLSTVLISETPRDEGPVSSMVHCVQTIKEECETEIEETALPDPLEVNQEPISTKKEAKIVIEVPNLQAQRKTPTAKEKTAQRVVKRAGTNPKATQEKLKRAKIEQNVTEKAQTEANSTQADVNNPKSSAPIDSDEIFGKVKIEFEELQRILEERRNKESFKSMKYKCESCVLGFTDYNRWQEHNTSFHDEEVGSCSCDICDRRFDDERQLSAHYRNHFVKFVCILCDFECYTKTGRMIHFKRHKGAILGADPDSVLRDRLMRASAGASSRDLDS